MALLKKLTGVPFEGTHVAHEEFPERVLKLYAEKGYTLNKMGLCSNIGVETFAHAKKMTNEDYIIEYSYDGVYKDPHKAYQLLLAALAKKDHIATLKASYKAETLEKARGEALLKLVRAGLTSSPAFSAIVESSNQKEIAAIVSETLA